VCAGGPASFSTTPIGSGAATFQWNKDGEPIPGATASSFSIAATTPEDAGLYSAVVSGACGTLETRAALLTVNSQVSASPPTGATVCVGAPVSFSTTAGGGGPYSYKWRKDGAPIPGAIGPTFAIASVTAAHAGAYSVEVSGVCGSVQSQPAQLTVTGVSTVYCTSQLNSLGCFPSIGAAGTPSASAGSGYLVEATNLMPGANGVFVYSTTGPASTPFQGGFLCSAPPLRRAPALPSTGSDTCSGILRIDFNATIASGADAALEAGATFWGQFWSRDGGSAGGSNLTDAVTAVICP
jgi:hypothetical protein